MKIDIYDPEDNKPDYKIKLVYSFGCVRVVAYNQEGKSFALVEIEKDGHVKLCRSDLNDLS